MSWSLKPIDDFCKTGSGGTPSRKQQEKYYGGSIPWVKSGELRESVIFSTEESITETAIKETSAKIIPAGALLIAMYGATIGRIATLGIQASSNQAVCHILPDSSVVDQRYMFYALSQQVPTLIRQGVGGAQPNISQQIIRSTKIPIPSLDEQHRIAAILDKADAVRRKRKEAIALTEDLLRSAFLEMFGEPVKNEKDWPQKKIKEIGDVQLGRQRAPKYQSGKYTTPYLRVANVYEDRLKLSNLLSMDFTEKEKKIYLLVPGDILLNEGQSTELVGRPAMWRDELSGCCFQNTLVRFRSNNELVLPEYALDIFLWYLHTGVFAKISSKTSSVAHLGAARFGNMLFPLPPLSLQKEWQRLRLNLNKSKTRLEEGIKDSENLFNSLLQRAFRGDL